MKAWITPIDPADLCSATEWPLPDMDPQDRFGVRLSIGLEATDDLRADLERGFAARQLRKADLTPPQVKLDWLSARALAMAAE